MNGTTSRERLVRVTMGPVALEGNLTVPEAAAGVVLFAHGSGSSRHSPRNRFVARALNAAGLGAALPALPPPGEGPEGDYNARLRFDIDLLAERVAGATDWLARAPATARRAVGYFGASTGAAAALVAAAARPA